MGGSNESESRAISRRRFLQIAAGLTGGTLALTVAGRDAFAASRMRSRAMLNGSAIPMARSYYAANADDLGGQYDQLEADLRDLERLLSECKTRGIPTDYETVDHAVIERFIEYGRDDIQSGDLSHAQYVADVLEDLYTEAKQKLSAYLAGTTEPFSVPRYVTGDVEISDYAFSADTVVPPGTKVRKRPAIFQGYGHFTQVREDVPNFQSFGTDIIQIEIGPNSVVQVPDPLAYWAVFVASANVSFTSDTTVHHSGQGSLKIVNRTPASPNVYGTIYQGVGVQPNTTYNFSAWVKGENVKYLQFTLTPSWVPRYSAPNGTYDWTEVKWQYTTGPNETSLTFRLLTGDVMDSAWIDDVSMTAEGSSENLIRNPGFDSGTDTGNGEYTVSTDAIRNDIQKVLEDAAKHDVAVCLLTSPHYFPSGAYSKWPEIRIPNPNFIQFDVNHPKAREIIKVFLETLIPLVKDYPSLHSICLSNEPTYVDSHTSVYTQRMWHDYLSDLYGSIDKLNSTYGSGYDSFDDVPVPPASVAETPYFYDWMTFNDQMFAAWHKWMADIIHEKAPDIPVHVKTLAGPLIHPWFSRGALTWGVDPEQFSELSQINGDDNYNFLEWGPSGYLWELAFYDLQRSLKRAPVFNSEDHIIADFSGNFSPQEATHARSALWQATIHGRSASTIWVWERILEKQGYNLMLDRPDVVANVGRTALDLNRLGGEVTALQEKPSNVAILYSLTAAVYSGAYLPTVSSTYQALSFSGGQHVDFISEKQIREGKLKRYKLLVVPEATHVHTSTLSGIKKFLQTQGTALLVGDDALRFSEHNEALSTEDRDYVLQSSEKLPSNTPADQLTSRVLGILSDLRLDSVVLLDPDTGKPVENVEWRSVPTNDGWLINVDNYAQQPRKVRILTEGQQVWVSQDLISGEKLSGETVTLEGLRPYLLRVRRSEQKPGVSITGVQADIPLLGLRQNPVAVSVENATNHKVTVAARIQGPEGWKSGSATQALESGSSVTLKVPVTPSATPSIETISAEVISKTTEVYGEASLEVISTPRGDAVPLALDSGSPTSPLLTTYSRLSPDDLWDASKGYGWVGTPPDDRDRGKLDDLRRDFTLSRSPATLRVQMPAGKHSVYLLIGDASYSSGNTIVSVGGQKLVENGSTLSKGEFRWLSFKLDGGSSGQTKDLVISGENNNYWRLNALVMLP